MTPDVCVHAGDLSMTLLRFLTALAVCAGLAFSQSVTTSTMDGTVSDPQGSAIVGAAVTIANSETGQTLKAVSDDRGHWVLPAMPAGLYRVSVGMQGFRTSIFEAVKMDAGVPATVNARLEVGAVTETVDVSSSAALVQSTSSTISSTIQQRQVLDLPFLSRGGMDLLVTQAGVQTGNTNRSSFINGLPLSAINVTLDGINTQDNYYKNGDGFFSLIPLRQDALEEITLSTS